MAFLRSSHVIHDWFIISGYHRTKTNLCFVQKAHERAKGGEKRREEKYDGRKMGKLSK